MLEGRMNKISFNIINDYLRIHIVFRIHPKFVDNIMSNRLMTNRLFIVNVYTLLDIMASIDLISRS